METFHNEELARKLRKEKRYSSVKKSLADRFRGHNGNNSNLYLSLRFYQMYVSNICK